MTAKRIIPHALTRAAGRLKKPWVVVVAAAILVSGGGGIALAVTALPPPNTIEACYNTATGALRVIFPIKGQKCVTGQTPISWDVTGITWAGTWSSVSGYAERDVVEYKGSAYITPTGIPVIVGVHEPAPPSDTSHWALLAQAGATGATGGTGATGPQGPQGPAGPPAQPSLSRVAALNWWGTNINSSLDDIDYPNAIAFDGTHLWIANSGNNTVTELNADNGSLVRVLSGSSYGFDSPQGLAFDGQHIWVTNASNSTMTVIDAATGAAVLDYKGSGLNNPISAAFDATNNTIWAVNANGDSVTEFSWSPAGGTSTGITVTVNHIFTGFSDPTQATSDGTHVWVTNWNSSTVSEINPANNSITTLPQSTYQFSNPNGSAFDGTTLWVVNHGNSTVTYINAATGAFEGVLSNTAAEPYDFSAPAAIACDGPDLWVVNETNNSVTEFDASNGSLIRVLSSPSYGFSEPAALAYDGSHMWVANFRGASVTEIG